MTETELAGQSRTALQKALPLAVHAATVRDLSNAMKNLIMLERLSVGAVKIAEREPCE